MNNTKQLFVIVCLFLSFSINAQEAVQTVAYSPTKSNINYPNRSSQEKEVHIHRYVLDGRVDIELHSPGKAVFSILNIEKEEVRSYEMTFKKKSMHSITIGDLPMGSYYIRVKKDNQSFVRKVLLE